MTRHPRETMPPAVSLNSDIGEGFGAWEFGDDAAILGHVTAANIACGFHGGDPRRMSETAAIAVSRRILIGAHVSYRDLAGFGRREMTVPRDELAAEIVYQIGALRALAGAAGGDVVYVKPHGALYNSASSDPELAETVIHAIRSASPDLAVFCMPGSELWTAGSRAGSRVVAEVFADRGYLDDGRLAPRSSPYALVTDPDAVVRRTLRMVREGLVSTVTGGEYQLPAPAETVCVHSDTPGAGVLVARLAEALAEAGIEIGRSPAE